jgi:hypothetical protein
MAEIKIEKKSSPMWPWILVVLFFMAILIYLFFPREERFDGDEKTRVTSQESYASSDTLEVSQNSTAVLAFVNFVNDDPNRIDIDHEFINEAFLRLINATKATANEIDYTVQKELGEVARYTDKVSTDPFETTHANSIRDAAGSLAKTLKNIQQKAFSGLASDADEVSNAAAAIKANVLTVDQKNEVKSFFRESADLLEKMNNTSPKL